MWTTTAATESGSPGVANEDWYHADGELIVVLDGATVRTDTGCVHGLRWYVEQLGSAIVSGAKDQNRDLRTVLRDAIADVAKLHLTCDLEHFGTPSASVAVLRDTGDVVQWLVLGDATIVLDTDTEDGRIVQAITDSRIRSTVVRARREAHRWPIGDPRKANALLGMKHQELAARNRPDGYWIAAALPAAADHAMTKNVPRDQLRRALICTDGIDRLVTTFKAMTWEQMLSAATAAGPHALIHRVRREESHDPTGVRYPRNKQSDDATAVLVVPSG